MPSSGSGNCCVRALALTLCFEKGGAGCAKPFYRHADVEIVVAWQMAADLPCGVRRFFMRIQHFSKGAGGGGKIGRRRYQLGIGFGFLP